MTKQATKKTESEPKIISLGATESDGRLELDLFKFLETRALIQASSGGGKSWLLRLICEQTIGGGVPVWLIDPEGEYVSLREKFDVVIFGEDDDLPADVETLRTVLPELLRQNVSCVFDLSELKFENQNESIVAVCDALIEQPRKEWSPLLLAVDEAQKLAPEGGSTPAMKAIGDVVARGRKRGKGVVVATQRLSALDKNITTQLLNRFIGLCLEDIEIKRAGNYLGKENAKVLLELNPGDFFALGSALNEKGSVRFRAGAIETTHPNSTVRQALSVVPKAGDALASVIENLREKLTSKTEVTDVEKPVTSISDDTVKLQEQIFQLQQELAKERNKIPQFYQSQFDELEKLRPLLEEMKSRGEKERVALENKLKEISTEFAEQRNNTEQKFLIEFGKIDLDAINKAFAQFSNPLRNTLNSDAARKTFVPKTEKPLSQKNGNSAKHSLSRPQLAILDTLKTFADFGLETVDRSNVAAFAGVSPKSSSFTNNLSVLKNSGGTYSHPPLIDYQSGGRLKITDAGRDYAKSNFTVATNEDLHSAWFKVLKSGKKVAMLDALIAIYPDAMTKKELASLTDQSPLSSSFTNYLSNLRALGLIDYGTTANGEKTAFATKLLFPFIGVNIELSEN